MAFADENNNGKCDFDAMGLALEPVSYHKPKIGAHTSWYDQKFEVDRDVTGLALKFRD